MRGLSKCLCCFFIMLFVQHGAKAGEVSVLGEIGALTLRMQLPDGYCMLDADKSEGDSQTLFGMRRPMERSHRIFAIAVRCDIVKAWRDPSVEDYPKATSALMVFTRVGPDGSVVFRPEGNRQEAIRGHYEGLIDASARTNQIAGTVNRMFKSHDLTKDASIALSKQNQIVYDKLAVYTLIQSDLKNNNSVKNKTSVFSTLFLHGYTIYINLNKDSIEAVVPDMFATVSAATRSLDTHSIIK